MLHMRYQSPLYLYRLFLSYECVVLNFDNKNNNVDCHQIKHNQKYICVSCWWWWWFLCVCVGGGGGGVDTPTQRMIKGATAVTKRKSCGENIKGATAVIGERVVEKE